MDTLILEGTARTPTIVFDAEQGLLEIKGRSLLENSIDFFIPLVEWIDGYVKTAKPETIVNIKLEYFNTGTSKCLLDVFKKLEKVNETNKGVTINWFYEHDDDDMLESGEEYAFIIKLKFNFIEIVY